MLGEQTLGALDLDEDAVRLVPLDGALHDRADARLAGRDGGPDLRVVDGPFRGTTKYEIQRSGGGSRVRVRNAGDADKLPVPVALVEGPLKAAMEGDLARLKVIVEGPSQTGRPTAGPASAGPATSGEENA